MKWLVKSLLTAILVLILSNPASGATAVPVLPDNAELLILRGGQCDSGPAVWMELWDTTGDGEYAEIVRYGRGSPDPILWMFFQADTSELLYIVLTLPGQAPEKLSLEQVERRYPNPCTLPYGPVA